MLSRRATYQLLRALRRRHISYGTKVLLAAADKPAEDVAVAPAKKATTFDVNPDDPQIAPTVIPWKKYKNEYYEKRGYKVADQSWKEWSDLPSPYKYLGVKVNPEHVETHGLVWKFFSDWKTAIPTAILLSLPLWMFSILPPFDERMELGLITMAAGWVAISNAGPFFRQWKRTRVATKVKGILEAEKSLNDELASTMEAYKAGSSVVDYIKLVNAGERALREVEAEAATKKAAISQRDHLVEQLNYLVMVQQGAQTEAEGLVLRSARAIVEGRLESDKKLQQQTVDSAIRALTSKVATEDAIGPVFQKALEDARAEVLKSAAARPFANAQQIELFKKRFGYDKPTPGKYKAPISYLN